MPSLQEFCPRLRDNASCLDPACQYAHIMHTCKPCAFVSPSEKELKTHLQSKAHKRKLANVIPEFYNCTICHRLLPGGAWTAHAAGAKHKRKCASQGVNAKSYKPVVATVGAGVKLCGPCQVQVREDDWNSHQKSKKHKEQQQWDAIRIGLEKAELDKNGVSLQGDFSFDFVELSAASTGGLSNAGRVSLTDPNARVTLVNAVLASSKGKKQSPFNLSPIAANQVLKSGQPISLSISIKQGYPGRSEDRLELVFKDNRSGAQFVIARPLYAIVGNKADYDRLKPTIPYKPRSKLNIQPVVHIIPGVPLPAVGGLPNKAKIEKAKIPKELEATLAEGAVGQILKKLRSSFIPDTLDSRTHGQHFKNLVWIEEYRQAQDIRMYDMFNVKLTSPGVAFRLKVPGLSEKRPSVLTGDQILVQPKGITNGHWFEGFVHQVELDTVLIHFGGTFKQGWSKDKLYNVQFRLNRTMIRRQQFALGLPFFEDRILFPTSSHLRTAQYVKATSYALQTVNRDISTNPRQLQAVVSIIHQPKGSPPFIVFGPPGTGKTVTIVEAIRQVLVKDPDAKVFACAPSNSAADLITMRLMDLGDHVVFRYYAPTRQKIEVPNELMRFTFMKDNRFSAPPLTTMNKYRVVIATCGSSIFATNNVKLARGHFSHLFVDEAGQASEPEVMIAIKTIPDSRTNIILSGDPKQLGPVIRSAVARQLNMEESYLERLMKNGPYNIQSNYGTTVVKLVKNFRSHNAILKFPSERFYDDELQPCGDGKIINSFLNSRYLPNSKFPVVFHGVQGKDDREASSPSFFNVDEVLVVADYVKRLLAEKQRFNITDEDIGVISPYHAQSRKIRTQLKGMLGSEHKVKIDSVEGFQGQERRVIIISTVRSSTEYIEYDLKHTLGFVANPRRFNVAVTRAQALLIVVGDPTVLSLDPLWRSFLNYIYNNRGWTGSPITWDPTIPVDEAARYDHQIRDSAASELRELSRRIEELTLENTEDGDGNIDRPWRAEE